MNTAKWKDVSRVRNEMYGIAIISIILFHFFEDAGTANYVGSAMKAAARIYDRAAGSIGVDIFLFLSGYSICYSLRKERDTLRFYKKRFFRVAVPYLALGGIYWFLREFIVLHESIADFVYQYSLLSFWLEGERTFWYISLICCLYAVSPFVFSGGKKSILITGAGTLVVSAGIYAVWPEVFSHIEIALVRIPVYFIGMYCASLADEGRGIPFALYAALALFVPVKLIIGRNVSPLARIFNAPYAVFLVLLYVAFRNMARTDNRFFAFLSKAGHYSLELYIVHVAIRALLKTMDIRTADPVIHAAYIAVSVLLSVGHSRLHEKVFMRKK